MIHPPRCGGRLAGHGHFVTLSALALAGCSQAAPPMTVAVSGAPDAVGAFVIAERAWDAGVEVMHADGTETAVFA